ncbi:DUF1707 domain-containing protein [Skermania piniformis]|uniref:DUF1707 domain-containing protein n=1 Tax=Skermania pinensis TaxID=39122 RepID=A0ABX8S7P7_9ACTN|nr:DUF1707 domain-containing protein [Skermania piniformis]QXQ13296.1 DUF1707 domain-containing protein [Skermania piniformis]
MADRPETRIDAADRARASAALDTHYAAGRLSTAELDERRAAVTDATSRAELDAIFVDLPDTVAPPAPAARPTRDWSLVVAILLPIVAIVVATTTGSWWWLLLIPAGGMFFAALPTLRKRRR